MVAAPAVVPAASGSLDREAQRIFDSLDCDCSGRLKVDDIRAFVSKVSHATKMEVLPTKERSKFGTVFVLL